LRFYNLRLSFLEFGILLFFLSFVLNSSLRLALPGSPVDLSAIEVTGTTVRLAWRPPSVLMTPGSVSVPPIDPTLSYIITYYERQEVSQTPIKTAPIQNTDFTVSELRPHTAYVFRVLAANSVGQGALSESLDVTTDELG
jgi:Fibronectin type III domain